MLLTMLIRFLVGGIVVCAFAMTGEVVEPKSLAGVFGAAPSVAIATLSLTIWKEGRLYASQESRSMVAGGLAFLIYAWCCMAILPKTNWKTRTMSAAMLIVWGITALGCWFFLLR
jgi:hypothetical protein